MRRLATLCLFLAACDSSSTGPVIPPIEPPASEAFSLAVTVRDAGGMPVSGLPVALHFFPRSVPRPSSRPAVADLFPVTPSPWSGTARLGFRLDEATTVRIELLDVTAERRRVIEDGMFAAGVHQLAFADEDGTLPGGAYTVRLIAGTDTLQTRTIHSDTNGDGFESVGRALGTTDAAGRVRTTDRTAVPVLYVSAAAFPTYDELGNSLGEIRFTRDMEVVVDLPDGQQIRTPAVVRDGANTVEVRLP